MVSGRSAIRSAARGTCPRRPEPPLQRRWLGERTRLGEETMIESLNPTTGAKLATYDTLPREQVLDQLAASRAAYFTWRGTSIVNL